MQEPTLAELQYWMKSRIRPSSGRGAAHGARAVALNPQGGAQGEERIAVYAEGYLARIEAALSEVYEAVRFIVGDETFAALARSYAEAHPSHETNLSFAGRHLPDFLHSQPLGNELPFLPDLARLEWQACVAFHAVDEPAPDLSNYSRLTPEAWAGACFLFQPSVAVVDSAWPILDIWNARKRSKKDINIELIGRPQSILVCRQEFKVQCRLLTRGQSQMLRGLMGAQSLETVCEKLTEDFEENVSAATAWFSTLVRDRLIASIRVRQKFD